MIWIGAILVDMGNPRTPPTAREAARFAVTSEGSLSLAEQVVFLFPGDSGLC